MTPGEYLDQAKGFAENAITCCDSWPCPHTMPNIGLGILHVLIALAAADPAITGETPPHIEQSWQRTVAEALDQERESTGE